MESDYILQFQKYFYQHNSIFFNAYMIHKSNDLHQKKLYRNLS